MRKLLALFLCLLPFQALADAAEDKGYITSWLEENLSGAGRKITIDGFQGALSSQASLTQLTIADDTGIWLTLKDVTLDWSQSALFSGEIAITQLSAGEIDLERLPVADPATSLPTPEATPFNLTLPEIPVAISIKGIAARKIVLGKTVLGQPVEASLSAEMTLSGGEGAAQLDLVRAGATGGHVTLRAGFSNATQVLSLSLDAAEDAGGIAASLLGVPGVPATALKIDGSGPLSDFAAKVDLATDGTTRLAGQVVLKDDGAGNRSFEADLGGDPTPVFLPDYADFFGPNVALQVKGAQAASGALRLDSLSVQSQALQLSGDLALAPDGQPERLNLTGALGLAKGNVTLPVASTEPITVGRADLTLRYDRAEGPLWHFASTVNGLDTGSFAAGAVTLSAEGQLEDQLFNGTAQFAAQGLAPRDAGLAQALGDAVTGLADFNWNKATSALEVSNLSLTAPGYAVQTKGTIGGMGELTGSVAGHYDDLSRLSVLTGRALKGALRFDVAGSAEPLSGAFDLTGRLAGTGLAAGVAEVDRLLAGQSTVSVSARRDETGTVLRAFSLQAGGLTADLTGTLASAGSDLSGRVSFADLSVLGAGYRGSLSGEGRFEGTLTKGDLTATAKGEGLAMGQPQVDGLLKGTTALAVETGFSDGVATLRKAEVASAQGKVSLLGTASADASALTAVLDLPDLSVLGAGFKGGIAGKAAFTGKADAGRVTLDVTAKGLEIGQAEADKLLRGTAQVSADLALTPDGVQVTSAKVTTPQLTAQATGQVAGAVQKIALTARLANLALLYPQFPGALTVSGSAEMGDAGTRLDIAAKGPGQIDAKVTGTLAPGFGKADLRLTGSATAALANAVIAPRTVEGGLRFDLRLNGPLALSSMSGPVTLTGGRLADPSLSFALKDIAAKAILGGGRVALDMTSALSTGGKIAVSGGVGLTAPYVADIAVRLDQAILKDPQLYTTKANGTVTFKGPATGGAQISGAIALGKTELRIPSTGFGADGGLPGLKHVRDSGAVAATRARAGVGVEAGGGASGPAFGLNLTISAPNQVFIRGRGLDAELGGALILRGTTAAIAPSGAFNLIRGRLDILGKRLVLSEVTLQMQGALVPYVHVLASIEGDGITSSVQIEGDAGNPAVTFVSNPELPQEEVLAHILFNRGLSSISGFQAAQLAAAVATLAGSGGEGVLGNIRAKTGLDNLDVQADATGNTSVTAGKYLSEKTYTEVTVDQAGKSSISLNYDVSGHITLKGRVDSEGNSGVGVFLKKDY